MAQVISPPPPSPPVIITLANWVKLGMSCVKGDSRKEPTRNALTRGHHFASKLYLVQYIWMSPGFFSCYVNWAIVFSPNPVSGNFVDKTFPRPDGRDIHCSLYFVFSELFRDTGLISFAVSASYVVKVSLNVKHEVWYENQGFSFCFLRYSLF